VIEVVSTPAGVLELAAYGFTRCVRSRGVLDLSSISALDDKGQVVGDDLLERSDRQFVKPGSVAPQD
jgi:hypothetical protein